MSFRAWLKEMWYNHVDELMSLGMLPPRYNLKDYFQRYRWWLKREYRHQQGENRGS
jgi:hypothetical protein